MQYEPREWNSPKNVDELMKYLQTLRRDTKVDFDVRLLICIKDDGTKKYTLQKRDREAKL